MAEGAGAQLDKTGRARIRCYQGTQAERCRQRSVRLDRYEAQLTAYLAGFRIPTTYQAQIVALLHEAEDGRDDGERQCRKVTARLERIKELYAWGDLDREAYQRERDALTAELMALPSAADQAAVLTETAGFLANLPTAWETATPEERNRIARLLFQQVALKDDRVATLTVQPDFAPFFWLDCQASETDVSKERKRRDSNPRSQP